jgi:hypothetical protein
MKTVLNQSDTRVSCCTYKSTGSNSNKMRRYCSCNVIQQQLLSFHQLRNVIIIIVLPFLLFTQLVHSQQEAQDDVATTTTTSTVQNSADFQITNLVLVNADTGSDIVYLENNMIVDTSSIGTQALTIRADIVRHNDSTYTTTSSQLYVLWDLDNGVSRRIESTAPYMLAGKQQQQSSPNRNPTSVTDAYEFFPSNVLRRVGQHVVIATPVPTMNAIDAIPDSSGYKRTFYIRHDGNNTFTEEALFNEEGCIVAATNTTSSSSCTQSSTSTTTTASTDVQPIFANRFGKWNTIRYSDSSSSSIHNNIKSGINTRILAFSGPIASEHGMTDPGVEYRPPSTFADYRCDLIVTISDNNNNNNVGDENDEERRMNNTDSTIIIYPCYYSGTGNAANAGDIGGFVWQCPIRHTPKNSNHDVAAETPYNNNQSVWYQWTVSFVTGTNIATTTYMSGSNGNPADFFHNQRGEFELSIEDKVNTNTTGNSMFRDATTMYTGLDMIDFLNYIDFDGAPVTGSNTYASFASYGTNDTQHRPTWGGGQRGAGIMSMVAKIQQTKNVNSISITTLSLLNNVHPFIDPLMDRLSYDISKLAQWEVVFRYAADVGISTILNLQENDIVDYEERHLYIREMVARFGQYVTTYSVDSLQTAVYIRTLCGNDTTVMPSILWRVNMDTEIVSVSALAHSVDGIQLVIDNPTTDGFYEVCKNWKLSNEEIAIVASVSMQAAQYVNTSNHFFLDLVWSNLFAGGTGVFIQPTRTSNNSIEAIYGGLDLLRESFTMSDPSVDTIRTTWGQMVTSFTSLPRICNDELSSSANTRCLSDNTLRHIALYVSANVTADVIIQPLDAESQYSVEWIDPTTGTINITNTTTLVATGNLFILGGPPNRRDWIAWLVCKSGCESQR